MDRFSEKLNKIWKEKPDKVSYYDMNDHHMTNFDMDILSGKIARYLLDNNIGKEDVVMICLPRGIEVMAAVFGIIKVGACFIAMDDFIPNKRVEYIKKDSKCKIVIDENVIDKIKDYDPIYDFVDTDVHDLCFIVYTSGSSGNPKGVMLEYGALDMNIVSMGTESHMFADTKSYMNLTPVSYLAFQCSLSFPVNDAIYCMSSGDLLKKLDKLDEAIEKYDVESIFLPAALASSYIPKAKSLKYIVYAGSVVKDVCLENVHMMNLYAMSEVGYIMSGYDIDKKYDITPIGKSLVDTIFIENDKEEGELLARVPYSRGYIGLEEETKKKFIDGVFRTGDYAKRLKSGDYVVFSRIDDMVNINGNRVELAEISKVFTKVSGIKDVVSRYIEKKNNSYIVVYYIADKDIDKKYISDKMSEYLPEEIMPRVFMRLDSFPLNQNAKIDKKNFPIPILGSENNNEKPENEIEEELCRIFAKIFEKDYISPLDDFVEMGCDSLVAIKILLECSEYNLTYGDIIRYKTPRAIAKHIIEAKKDEKKLDVDSNLHELLPGQEYYISEQYISKDTDKNNLCFTVKLRDNIDIKKLCDAINKSIDIHPALEMMAVKDENNFYQVYKHSLYKNVNIVKCTKKEYDEYIKKQRKSFDLFNEYGYRVCIYDIEGEKYFSSCFHHFVMDLVSIDIWAKDVEKIYNGEKVKLDYYFDMINEFDVIKKTDRFKTLNSKLIEKGKNLDIKNRSMSLDKEVKYIYDNNLKYPTYIGGKTRLVAFDAKIPKKNVTSFYSTCLAKTIADYNGVDEVTTIVVDSARNDKSFSNTCGCMVKDMLITHDFKGKSFNETMSDVKNQILEQRKKDYNILFDTIMATISVITKEMSFSFFGEKIDINNDRQMPEECDTDTEVLVVFSDNGATVSIEFDANFHDEKNIEKFVNMFKENIEKNIENVE